MGGRKQSRDQEGFGFRLPVVGGEECWAFGVWLDWEFGRGGAGVEVGDGFGGESDFMICFGVWGFRG